MLWVQVNLCLAKRFDISRQALRNSERKLLYRAYNGQQIRQSGIDNGALEFNSINGALEFASNIKLITLDLLHIEQKTALNTCDEFGSREVTIKTFLKQEFLKQIRCYHKYSNTKKNKLQGSQILLAQLEKKDVA